MLVRAIGWMQWVLPGFLCLVPSFSLGEEAAVESAAKYWVYVGTYSQRGSKGIYRFEMDAAGGKLASRSLVAEVKDPSFLAIAPGRKFLYSVNEISDFAGKPGGGVSAFAIDPRTGDLTLLNQKSSVGAGPCHIVVDRLGKHVLVANYGGGSAAVLPIAADGRLGDASAFVQHKGTSVNPQRQEAPHAHSINLDTSNRFACVADLGLDQVVLYRFDTSKGTLTANDPPHAKVAPGSGPRHFAFHPTRPNAYVINELANTVTVFEYDDQRGSLKSVQTISTLPAGFTGTSYTAEVQVHPSGKFLYGSNRGHNSIAVFAIDPQTGRLTLVGHQAENIKTPRNFGIDPAGKFLLVGNQDSDSIVVFRIDAATGNLQSTGISAEVPMPVCVRIIPASQ